MVGEVVELGPDVENHWLARRVFTFNPHEDHFIAHIDGLLPVPEHLSTENAVFLPNMETAINFLMDGHPLIGERAAVFGQGIVGLLTTALLASFPLAELLTVDPIEKRRAVSLELGATQSISPATATEFKPARESDTIDGYDLIYELSGTPEALDQAINLTGFDSRIVVGSWYGEKKAPLTLGREFHRNRVKIISSQVSTIAAEHRGRWDKERRFSLAWEKLTQIEPAHLITHRFHLHQAADAYRLLDQQPAEAVQIIFDYRKSST
jgi:threonine dehydrogenase-like Zn-dependent dehydrogenase